MPQKRKFWGLILRHNFEPVTHDIIAKVTTILPKKNKEYKIDVIVFAILLLAQLVVFVIKLNVKLTLNQCWN